MRRPEMRVSSAEARLAGSKKLRTFALVGHRSAGKTSLAELLLQAARVTREVGVVDLGTALLDWTPLERRRRQSLEIATAWFDWRDTLVQLVDTPGTDCLEGLRDAALAGCDAAMVVIDARAGIEQGTRSALAAAEALAMPVIAVVTKVDLTTPDRDDAIVAELTAASGIRAVPIEVSDRGGEAGRRFGPAAIAAHREALTEIVALGDELLLQRYLEDLQLPDDVVAAGLPRAVLERRFVPVLFACPTRGIGAEAVLDAVVSLVPSPLDRPLRCRDASGSITVLPREGPFVARVLSTHRDDDGAAFHLLRVEAGSSAEGELRTGASETVRIRKLYRVRGPRRSRVVDLVPGSIVATWDPLPVRPGDTIAAAPGCVLDPPSWCPPMASWSLRSTRKRGAEHLVETIQPVVDADPGLRLSVDTQSGTPLLSGQDEDHLRLAIERIEAWTGAKVVGELPRVGYRELPVRAAPELEGLYRVDDSDGLAVALGCCRISLRPILPEDGFRFVDDLGSDEEDIPRSFRPAVVEGVRTALLSGPAGGYPVVGAEVHLVGGRYDLLVSTEEHFRKAGEIALRSAMERAGTRLLEPWWEIELTVPAESLGELVSDLGAHRGRVLGVDVSGGSARLLAATPYRELRTFGARLKRLTGGRGRYVGREVALKALPDALVAEAVEASPLRDRVTLPTGRLRGDASSPPSPRSGRRPGP